MTAYRNAGRKKKYDADTEMLAVRIPGPLHGKLRAKAISDGKPKSDVVVEALEAAMSTDVAPPADAPSAFE